MVPVWDNLLLPSSNIHYPLRFSRNKGLLDNDENLTLSQFLVEIKDGL